MKKKKKENAILKTIEKRMSIIKDFADKMGYTVRIEEFNVCVSPEYEDICSFKNGEHCISIELCEKVSDEGVPYYWMWSLETGKERY